MGSIKMFRIKGSGLDRHFDELCIRALRITRVVPRHEPGNDQRIGIVPPTRRESKGSSSDGNFVHPDRRFLLNNSRTTLIMPTCKGVPRYTLLLKRRRVDGPASAFPLTQTLLNIYGRRSSRPDVPGPIDENQKTRYNAGGVEEQLPPPPSPPQVKEGSQLDGVPRPNSVERILHPDATTQHILTTHETLNKSMKQCHETKLKFSRFSPRPQWHRYHDKEDFYYFYTILPSPTHVDKIVQPRLCSSANTNCIPPVVISNSSSSSSSSSNNSSSSKTGNSSSSLYHDNSYYDM
uniref:Uncharacterized protein n=1 Tax=Vespula pensylvanica TaxID=30213 RepID=A0A834PDJ2_VESPE|nr:hypothetical protein H0235_000135 [Vespula pensylvanica]